MQNRSHGPKTDPKLEKGEENKIDRTAAKNEKGQEYHATLIARPPKKTKSVGKLW